MLFITAGHSFSQSGDAVGFEVWAAPEKKLKDGRNQLVDTLVGWIHVQLLPIWLPKVRIDSTNTHSMAGWFEKNYLP